MDEKMSARDAAVTLLYRRERDGIDVSEGLKDLFSGELKGTHPREKAFARQLALGTVKRQITLDYALDDISSVKTCDMKPQIRVIMRLGLFQILYMNSVRDATAVDEAVKQAKSMGFSGLSGFVNGVLRRACRDRDEISDRIQQADMGVRHGMPEYPLSLVIRELGEEKAESVFSALDKERPVTLRPNAAVLKTNEELLKWEEDISGACQARRHPLVPEMLIVEDAGDIKGLPGFREGAFAVQDASGVLAVRAAGIFKEARVIDVCAAPGSKALCAAAMLGDSSQLHAWDLSESRLGMVKDNAKRLDLSGVVCERRDAAAFDEENAEKWDIVLCDPPCTGFGVMGRKPDIRFGASAKKTESLVNLQREILSCATKYVKPGGVLIYSTCTMSIKENEDNVRFLRETGKLRTENWNTGIEGLETKDGMLSLYPDEWETDGFFIARMVKK